MIYITNAIPPYSVMNTQDGKGFSDYKFGQSVEDILGKSVSELRLGTSTVEYRGQNYSVIKYSNNSLKITTKTDSGSVTYHIPSQNSLLMSHRVHQVTLKSEGHHAVCLFSNAQNELYAVTGTARAIKKHFPNFDMSTVAGTPWARGKLIVTTRQSYDHWKAYQKEQANVMSGANLLFLRYTLWNKFDSSHIMNIEAAVHFPNWFNTGPLKNRKG